MCVRVMEICVYNMETYYVYKYILILYCGIIECLFLYEIHYVMNDT